MIRSFHFYPLWVLAGLLEKDWGEGVTFTESVEISSHYLDLPFPLLTCKASIILVGYKFSAFKFHDYKFPAKPAKEKEVIASTTAILFSFQIRGRPVLQYLLVIIGQ